MKAASVGKEKSVDQGKEKSVDEGKEKYVDEGKEPKVSIFLYIITSRWQHSFALPYSLSLSFAIHPYHPSLPANPPNSVHTGLPNHTQCPYRDDVNMFLQVSQLWHVHVLGSVEKHRLKVCPCFSSSASHVLIVLLGRFMRWEVSGRTAAVL